mmetsp:Transcript_14880/g.35437  ORF Transcript_14880/g.35437 Transcript_14880/m.35437 type:complete len:382 (+) Transcript_14880:299-1444(+)
MPGALSAAPSALPGPRGTAPSFHQRLARTSGSRPGCLSPGASHRGAPCSAKPGACCVGLGAVPPGVIASGALVRHWRHSHPVKRFLRRRAVACKAQGPSTCGDGRCAAADVADLYIGAPLRRPRGGVQRRGVPAFLLLVQRDPRLLLEEEAGKRRPARRYICPRRRGMVGAARLSAADGSLGAAPLRLDVGRGTLHVRGKRRELHEDLEEQERPQSARQEAEGLALPAGVPGIAARRAHQREGHRAAVQEERGYQPEDRPRGHGPLPNDREDEEGEEPAELAGHPAVRAGPREGERQHSPKDADPQERQDKHRLPLEEEEEPQRPDADEVAEHDEPRLVHKGRPEEADEALRRSRPEAHDLGVDARGPHHLDDKYGDRYQH